MITFSECFDVGRSHQAGSYGIHDSNGVSSETVRNHPDNDWLQGTGQVAEQWHRNGLHHGNVRGISYWQNTALSHIGCYLSGRDTGIVRLITSSTSFRFSVYNYSNDDTLLLCLSLVAMALLSSTHIVCRVSSCVENIQMSGNSSPVIEMSRN